MKTKFRFINFTQAGQFWGCFNNRSGALLGHVSYYSQWKCWVFTAAPDCVFSSDCLRDISAFMDELKREVQG
jgi:hypothetical protein